MNKKIPFLIIFLILVSCRLDDTPLESDQNIVVPNHDYVQIYVNEIVNGRIVNTSYKDSIYFDSNNNLVDSQGKIIEVPAKHIIEGRISFSSNTKLPYLFYVIHPQNPDVESYILNRIPYSDEIFDISVSEPYAAEKISFFNFSSNKQYDTTSISLHFNDLQLLDKQQFIFENINLSEAKIIKLPKINSNQSAYTKFKGPIYSFKEIYLSKNLFRFQMAKQRLSLSGGIWDRSTEEIFAFYMSFN